MLHLNKAQLPGDCVEYRSLDSVPDKSQAFYFPNSLEVLGLPLHLLSMKVSAPIIILQLLDPSRVTNGIGCVITKLSANTIEAKISHGKYEGHDHMSRILNSTSLYILLYLKSVHCHCIKFEFITMCCHR